ncbi:hypothetical protein SEA_FANCYPANTS_67 [Mycobacterium phage Fancypants]|uniref:Uncharacterized protein n=1 Tax=Mycobacterium phage Fancypants TaxID=2530128 RepID=A0A481VU12_9CAUD|nr:hypothetical protein I5H36_gp067 [Mycobacterium phage Fancypants]QBI97404.1 hypothetical protein SEA_FANCYPANTS_67 [Mycobacterium phage Fancypants]
MSAIQMDTRLSRKGFPNYQVTVRRVAKDGTWCDLFVYDLKTRTSWTKRMALPLDDVWTVIE